MRNSESAFTFEHCGFALVRRALLPYRTLTDCLATPDGISITPSEYERQLMSHWDNPVVQGAVKIASPSLHYSLSRYDSLDSRQRDRSLRSFGHYINRMSIRATPFGGFVGVAVGVIDAQYSSSDFILDTSKLEVLPNDITLDWEWIRDLARTLDRDTMLNERARITVNDLVHIAAQRICLATADDGADDISKRRVSVKRSKGVLAVIENAQESISVADLAQSLCNQYPEIKSTQALRAIETLYSLDILIPADQRPVLIESRPEMNHAEIRRRFNAEQSATFDELEKTIQDPPSLAEMAQFLKKVEELSETLTASAWGKSAICINSTLGTSSNGPAEIRIPESTAVSATRSVQYLSQLSPASSYPTHLQDFAFSFVERYGLQAEVSVLDLLSDEGGLGAPRGYFHPPSTDQATPSSMRGDDRSSRRRQEALARIAMESVADGSITVSVDSILASLPPVSQSDDRPLYPVFDVFLQIGPNSNVTVTDIGTALGGRSAARFHRSSSAVKQSLQSIIEIEEKQTGEEFVEVELAYRPLSPKASNVASRPQLRKWEMNINCASAEDGASQLKLSDIRVGVNGGRFYLYAPKIGSKINVCQASLLNAMSAPNACRFILEVCNSQFRVISAFNWGDLEDTMPFLPRIEQDGITLRRARWLMQKTDLPDARSAPDALKEAIVKWRSRWNSPRFLSLSVADASLLIDLESEASTSELRLALEKQDVVALQEVPNIPDMMINAVDLDDYPIYATEVVVPVALQGNLAVSEVPATRPAESIKFASKMHAPGSDWITLKLYLDADSTDSLILNEIKSLMLDLNEDLQIDEWHFIRYADPKHHVRLRVKVGSACWSECVTNALRWANGLVVSGLLRDVAFVSYSREVERYGGIEEMPIAERFFTADSEFVARILELLPLITPTATRDARLVMCALSLEMLLRKLLASNEAIRDFVESRSDGTLGGPEYRRTSKTLWHDLVRNSPIWNELDAAAKILNAPSAEYNLIWSIVSQPRWATPESIIGSLAHMHCNRLGLSPTEEGVAWGMLRRDLRSRDARRGSHTPMSRH